MVGGLRLHPALNNAVTDRQRQRVEIVQGRGRTGILGEVIRADILERGLDIFFPEICLYSKNIFRLCHRTPLVHVR